MYYTLGLDIGIGSVGWAVLCNDAHGKPYKIADLGVRVFTAAEHPKTGASLAAPRRLARGARRRLRRKRHRKERIRNLLISSGMITKEQLEEIFIHSNYEKDVYSLRAEGLDRQLEPEEWVRVLIHLTQRRGYSSNSTAESARDKDNGAVKSAISKNQQMMQEKGYRTIGEMFCNDDKFKKVNADGSIWRKTRNDAGEYAFTVTREMVKQEVCALFAAQRQFGNPFAAQSLEEQYSGILFAQRHFDDGPGGDSPFRKGDLRGKCTFEPEELRAFKACYTFEYFKLLQDLNHIRIQSLDASPRCLTLSERQTLIDLAKKSSELTYLKLRKVLKLSESETFNCVYYANRSVEEAEKKSKFSQMKSYHEIRKTLDRVEKGYINQLTADQLDEIATVLSLYKADDRRRHELQSLNLDEAVIQALLPLSFSKAGRLSLTAMRKMIPYLEQGKNYNEACAEVYGDHRGKTVSQKHHTISLTPEFREESGLTDLNNPVVLRAIAQTTKVVNAIVRRYGSPQRVCIELAREMRKNFQERDKLKKAYEKRQKENETVMEKVEAIKGGRATGLDLVKYRLYEEQNGLCLYSGRQLDVSRLFEPGYVDVDHIIPYSKCFDDGYQNKVLVRSAENRQKGNRLPLEYLAGDPERVSCFKTLVETTVRDFRKRQRLLKSSWTQDDEQRFKERNLVDTQYATRVVLRLFGDYLELTPLEGRKKQVMAVNGAVTDYLRKRFGLAKNRADGDLHHAMDAAVIAVVNDSMIQKVTSYAQRRENAGNALGSYTDPETGEVLSQREYDQKYGVHFPEPWPNFRQELLARLSPDPEQEIFALGLPSYDPQERIMPVLVSQVPQRRVSGAAHEDTIRGVTQDRRVVSKTPLQKLTLDKNGEISDYYNREDDRLLYQALKARLQAFNGDAKAAFAEPFYKPRRDGTPGPLVKKVKICKTSSSNVAVCGGVANNENMIRADFYHVPGKGYYVIPIYLSDVVSGVLPQKAVTKSKKADGIQMDDRYFAFSLYKGDLIYVSSPNGLKLKKENSDASGEAELHRSGSLLYYQGTDRANATISATTHDRKYLAKGIGIRRLTVFEKYEVDPLGGYHKVRLPEKRQLF